MAVDKKDNDAVVLALAIAMFGGGRARQKQVPTI